MYKKYYKLQNITEQNKKKKKKKSHQHLTSPLPLPISKQKKKLNYTHFHTAITKQAKLFIMYKYIQVCRDSAKSKYFTLYLCTYM